MLLGKILSSKLDPPSSELVMTKDGPPLPTHCSKNCCLYRRGIVSGLISWLLSVIFSAPHTLFQQQIDNNKEFFQGSTDFDLMLLVNNVGQWLEKNVAESTGRKTLQESIPPRRLPVLASFLGCITVILKPDNPTFEKMQKKELPFLNPFPNNKF